MRLSRRRRRRGLYPPAKAVEGVLRRSLINNALNAILALGISEADAVSIIKEVGEEIVLKQAQWWMQRKCSQTAKEPGAAFRTACRGQWSAPGTKKPKAEPISLNFGTKAKPQSRQEEDYEPALKVVTAPKQSPMPSVSLNPQPTAKPYPTVTDPAWGRALETLEGTIALPTMQTHMRNLVPVSTKPGEWVLEAPSEFSANWLNRQYLRDLEQVATAIAQVPTTVQVIIAKRETSSIYAS